jgi:hypothetical protein
MNQRHLLATISDLHHRPTTAKVMQVLDALSYVLADQGHDRESMILEDFSRTTLRGLGGGRTCRVPTELAYDLPMQVRKPEGG